MLKYEVVVITWSNEDNSYIAAVPELPGCMVDGQTYQEAMENVQTIMQEWIETAHELSRPIPEPKCMPVEV